MRKLFGFIGGTIASYAGWYAGAAIPHAGFMTEFILSIVGLAVGGYYGVKYAREHYE